MHYETQIGTRPPTEAPASDTRVDMHCHSTASQLAKLGVQRAVGLPECATPPREVYELAKRRGMDFVTITDHDTIAGALEIADEPDVFISEELTTWFADEPQAVHLLCYGITPDDHDWLQAHARDLERVADYLHERDITCALAHPFFAVAAPLTARHRRRLAELFPIWEIRNGSRARELNAPAAIYIETHGGTGIGGSDDHAGVDIGRTFTEAPPARTPQEFLAHVRAGHVQARGKQGSAAKWAHSALALAVRSLGIQEAAAPDPLAVLRIVERVVLEGDARSGSPGAGLGPDDARRLLRTWLDSLGLEADADALLAHMQADDFSHSDFERRARRSHERRLAAAVEQATRSFASGTPGGLARAGTALFEACIPVVPYVPSTAFLAREKAKLVIRDSDPVRVALVADGIGGMHGVTHTLQQIRERGVPGYEIEVIGTDSNVDRRLAAVAEVDIPSYPGLKIGVPSLPAVAEALTEGRYDLVHLCAPGPAGAAAALLARLEGLPVVGSYHTELGAYTRLRTGDERLTAVVQGAIGAFYGRCKAVLSPSAAADASLLALGISQERIARWDRGVDLDRFRPELREANGLPGEVTVLYVGRLSREKGIDLLADAFLQARKRDPRLHLVLAGGGPEEEALRERLGNAATFLGWVEGERLARIYASADIFLFASQTDTFGQVILEAQASEVPVVAVDAGGPSELIAHGRTGLLAPPDPQALADEVTYLARRPALRARLAAAAIASVGDRSWERALRQLGDVYASALGDQMHPAAAEAGERTLVGYAA